MRPAKKVSKMDHRLAEKCRNLVMKTSVKYGVPPVYITAHIRVRAADVARREVWRTMIVQFGMTRKLVADIFGRDRRRLRKSVIGV